MSKTIKGSCLCQAISYQFVGPEFVFQYCHCSRCRKTGGSDYSPNIIIDPKHFEWLTGEALIGRFEHPEAKDFATSFCTRCGSNLPWQSQTGRAMVIPAGTLDDDPEMRPTQNIFYKDHVAWHQPVESMPQYDELQPRKPG